MGRQKAIVVGVLWLTAGCSVHDQRAVRLAGVDERRVGEARLEGCLLTGAAPGRFVLTDVTGGGPSPQAVEVMSTQVGLTAYVNRRVQVRGQELTTPPRSIHDGAVVFRIRSLDVVATSTRPSRSAQCP